MHGSRQVMKRVFDLIAAGTAVVLLAPLMLLISLLVRALDGSPILFRQTRPGLHEQPFTMLKFRTMTDARDGQGNLLPDAGRLTPLGRTLRRWSLDELPELLNVLKGDMSLVGPRPLLMKYLPYYTEEERKRFEVLPGITGLSQIKGRNDLPWDDRLALDAWYAKNFSLSLDLRILWGTLLPVWRGDGVQAAPGLTMLDLDEERARNGSQISSPPC